MEPRLIVAYTLLSVLAVAGVGVALILRRQRARRRRRLRGIKDHPAPPSERRLA